MSDRSEGAMDIGDFLEKEYEKFAIMGIFGTVSLFLISGFPKNSSPFLARAGTVASLAIFLLATAWLFWQATNQLFKPSSELDLLPRFGYLVIAICTGTLGFAIGSSLQADSFEAAVNLLVQVTLFLASVFAYLHYYPTNRYSQEEIDVDPTGGAAFPSITIYLFFHKEFSGIAEGISDSIFFIAGGSPLFFAIIHLMLSEALLGYAEFREVFSSVSVRKELRIQPYQEIISQTSGRLLLFCTSLVLFLLTFYIRYEASQYTGAGQFWIGGKGWKEWVVYHWLFIGLSSSVLIRIDEANNTEGASIQRFFKIGAGVAGIVMMIELVLLYFNVLGAKVIVL